MPKDVTEEFTKVRVYNKTPRKILLPEREREHPVHQPYQRENRGTLRHSLMIDGLGDENDDDLSG